MITPLVVLKISAFLRAHEHPFSKCIWDHNICTLAEPCRSRAEEEKCIQEDAQERHHRHRIPDIRKFYRMKTTINCAI